MLTCIGSGAAQCNRESSIIHWEAHICSQTRESCILCARMVASIEPKCTVKCRLIRNSHAPDQCKSLLDRGGLSFNRFGGLCCTVEFPVVHWYCKGHAFDLSAALAIVLVAAAVVCCVQRLGVN